MPRPGTAAAAALVAVVALGTGGCAVRPDPASAATGTATTAVGSPTTPAAPGAPAAAAEGTAAASQLRTFAPQRIRLVSDQGASAPIQGVDTGPGGELRLPANPGDVGWWVSGALAGEVFGSVVLAGHIDSRDYGLGFFARLLDAEPGDRIELSGDGLALTYVVHSNREVDKDALSTSTDIFDRGASGRLVLVTCTGRFDATTRHYDHNLVVVAEPVGVPQPH